MAPLKGTTSLPKHTHWTNPDAYSRHCQERFLLCFRINDLWTVMKILKVKHVCEMKHFNCYVWNTVSFNDQPFQPLNSLLHWCFHPLPLHQWSLHPYQLQNQRYQVSWGTKNILINLSFTNSSLVRVIQIDIYPYDEYIVTFLTISDAALMRLSSRSVSYASTASRKSL